MSSAELAEVAALAASLHRVQVNTLFSFASYGLLIYDYCLTFEAEVRLIWSANWNLTKMLFVLTRYPVFADAAMVLYYLVGSNLSPHTCTVLYNVSAWTYLWGIGAAEAILILRTWAIWGRDKRVGISLAVLFLLLWVVNCYFMSTFLKSLRLAPGHAIAPFQNGCLPVGGNNILYVEFVVLMAFETLVLALTLLKGIQSLRRRNSPLMVSLYRDGILFYIYLFVVSVSNVVVLLTAPPEYTNLLSALQRALHSIVSARLLLNLREASLRSTVLIDGEVVESGTLSASHMSGMHFKPGLPRHTAMPTIISVDDGTWVSGDTIQSQPNQYGECRSLELMTFAPQRAASSPP